MIRINYSYKGIDKVFEREIAAVLIGRHKNGLDIDLAPDMKVSRQHARILFENDEYWIEDLNSKQGTKVNGLKMPSKSRQRLWRNDVVVLGETSLKVDVPHEAEKTPD